MKPAAFEYVRARTLDEAVTALASYDGEAKILAGGQSLVPMLNFRLARPRALVDLNYVASLAFLDETAEGLRIGAMTRQRAVETSATVRKRFPVLAAAARHVGHLAIRNRGTFGGTLAHNDPAAEFPMIALLLNAKLRAKRSDGERTLAASEFFVGPLTSALADGEVLIEALLPWLPPGTGTAFEELSRRHGDFAIGAAAAAIRVERGRCAEARIALGGVGACAFRVEAAERLLRDQALEAAVVDKAVAAIREASDPASDIHGSADFRRHLAGELAERAIRTAWQRSVESSTRSEDSA